MPTPKELAQEIQDIITANCLIRASWVEHEGPITEPEMILIARDTAQLLEGLVLKCVEGGIDARRRIRGLVQ